MSAAIQHKEASRIFSVSSVSNSVPMRGFTDCHHQSARCKSIDVPQNRTTNMLL